MKKKLQISVTLIFGFILLGPLLLNAQDKPEVSLEDIAKNLSNPVAPLYSFPFKENMVLNLKRFFGASNTFSFQPVIPISLSSNINLIVRASIPVISFQLYENFVETELGDAVMSLFFTPSEQKNGFAWGIGPILQLPISTSGYPFGTEKWSIGPTVVVLKQINGWTYGALVNQIWSVIGNKEIIYPVRYKERTSQMCLQPFLSYYWKTGASLGISSEITRDWIYDYTSISINPTISGITRLGSQIVSLAAGPRLQFNPGVDNRADLGISASVIFVFPK